MKFLEYRRHIILAFAVLLGLSLWSAHRIYFNFEFEHFFPKGDPDLDFFYEFREQFEPDDNFLMVALENDPSVFDSDFLTRLDSLTRVTNGIEGCDNALSITNFKNVVRSPFGFAAFPIIHPDDPERFGKDSARMLKDPRLAGRLISEDATVAVIAIKTTDTLVLDDAIDLVDSVKMYIADLGFEDYHMLGRANFQQSLVKMQKKEFILATVISGLLVTIVFLLIFRRLWGVLMALISVVVSMLIFLGYLGQFSNPLDFMSALYPVLMIIVGVSDVVHLMTKYVSELRKGLSKKDAITITLKEIGLATFLTSFTTAIGFATLMTSKVGPVRVFGFNAAIGVLMAYGVIILFCTALISMFKVDKISAHNDGSDKWRNLLLGFYQVGKDNPTKVGVGVLAVLLFCGIGISLISTDVHIYNGLPRGEKVTEDFRYFEEKFNGFRPFEVAVITKGDHTVNEFEVMREIDKMETFINEQPEVGDVNSITTLYKSINRAYNGDKLSAYVFPEDEKTFEKYKKLTKKYPMDMVNVMVSKDEKLARISGKIFDLGQEKISVVVDKIKAHALAHTNTDIVEFKVTGTGVAFDKNNEYLRDSLLQGLSIAFFSVSLIMALLFRNLKMVVISLIPNVIPLLIGAAFIGYLGIELDAPTAIIFAISFGIAVDDTIHFLSKFKLEIIKGHDIETAIKNTFLEAGKAIIITSIILFFGFLILLISKTPGTFHVGLLISLTLFSAVFSDLFIIPLLVRWWMKDTEQIIKGSTKPNPEPELVA